MFQRILGHVLLVSAEFARRFKEFGRSDRLFNAGAAYALNQPALRLLGCTLRINASAAGREVLPKDPLPHDGACEVAAGRVLRFDMTQFRSAIAEHTIGQHRARTDQKAPRVDSNAMFRSPGCINGWGQACR